jgi:hypothetical protein
VSAPIRLGRQRSRCCQCGLVRGSPSSCFREGDRPRGELRVEV